MVDFAGPDAATWDKLAAHNHNIFQTRDFAEAWWSIYQPRGQAAILTDRTEDPRCIIPLYRRGKTMPLIRQIGHGPADSLGPLCAPEDRQLAAELIQSELGRDLRRGVLVLHDVPSEDAWLKHLDGNLVRSTPGPVIRLGAGSWDDYLATRSKNFRKQIRQSRKRVERNFDMTIRISTPETLDQDMDTLFRLHRLLWGTDAPFATGKQAQLARRFARMSIDRGRLRLSFMELDGQPVAAELTLRFAGVHSSWQSGRDPNYDQYSVGSVLLMDTIRAAAEAGCLEYRLLRGGEGYKQRLTDDARDTCTLAVTHGAAGATAIRTARTRRIVERRVRDLRETIAQRVRVAPNGAS